MNKRGSAEARKRGSKEARKKRRPTDEEGSAGVQIASAIILVAVLWVSGCAAPMASPNAEAAERAETQGDYKKAAETYRQTIAKSKSPDAIRQARFRLAKLLLEKLNQPQEAIAIYETILDAEPEHPESVKAAWNLGKYGYATQDYKLARKYLLRVILDFSDSPYDADARLWLAAAYEALIETPAAMGAYEDFIAKYPNDPRVAYAQKRGDALQQYERQEPPTVQELLDAAKMAAEAKPVAQTEPDEPPAERRPDPNALRVADGADARRPFGPPNRPGARQTLMTFQPSEIFKHNPKELMFVGGGLFGGEDLEESLAGNGANLDDALRALGMLYYQLEEFERAGACLERTVELGAEEPEMLGALAICYLKVDRPDKAKETVTRAAKADKKVFQRIYIFAENRADIGKPEEAKAALTMLVGIDPTQDKEIQKRIAAVQ